MPTCAPWKCKHSRGNAVGSPVNAVQSHRTPDEGSHFMHAQNKSCRRAQRSQCEHNGYRWRWHGNTTASLPRFPGTYTALTRSAKFLTALLQRLNGATQLSLCSQCISISQIAFVSQYTNQTNKKV